MYVPTCHVLQCPFDGVPSLAEACDAIEVRISLAETMLSQGNGRSARPHLAAARTDYRALREVLTAYGLRDEIARRLQLATTAIARG